MTVSKSLRSSREVRISIDSDARVSIRVSLRSKNALLARNHAGREASNTCVQFSSKGASDRASSTRGPRLGGQATLNQFFWPTALEYLRSLFSVDRLNRSGNRFYGLTRCSFNLNVSGRESRSRLVHRDQTGQPIDFELCGSGEVLDGIFLERLIERHYLLSRRFSV